MKSEPNPRQSDVVYVLAKLRVGGSDYALLRAHPKWGDWSLVGGHVEPSDASWSAAAAREVEEEMAPLRYGQDMVVEPLNVPASQWGPVPSRSASNWPTNYRAEWYFLRFKTDPRECLAKLPSADFCLVQVRDLFDVPGLSSIVEKAAHLFPHGWDSVPTSWAENLECVPLERITRSHPQTRPRVAEG